MRLEKEPPERPCPCAWCHAMVRLSDPPLVWGRHERVVCPSCARRLTGVKIKESITTASGPKSFPKKLP